MKKYFTLTALLIAVSFNVQAQDFAASDDQTTNLIEELDPFDPNIEQTLNELDALYYEETGKSPFLPEAFGDFNALAGCQKSSCAVWIRINKSTQSAALYLNGNHVDSWAVSTGVSGHGTPNFERHPNGRIYDKYTSSKYPGGSYNGLGNMPYAMFIRGGFAMHGTPKGNWSKLGSRASHGCIRMHPDNAYRLNRLIRKHGIKNTWVSVY